MTKTSAQRSAARRRKAAAIRTSNGNLARSKASKARQRADKLKDELEPTGIPGAGDGLKPELTPAASAPETADFTALLSATPRELGLGDAKASAQYASERLLPHLLVLQHGPTMASYMLATAIFHVVRLLRHLRRDPQRLRAVRRALGFGKGKTPYLELLNGLAPPPEEDGTGVRKVAQNRHSNMNRALVAAEREGLRSRQLFQRLVDNGGFENLIERARAEGVGDEGERDEDGDEKLTLSMKRSERRKAEPKQKPDKEDDGWSTSGPAGPAKREGGTGGALALTVSKQSTSEQKEEEAFAKLRASPDIRAAIAEGEGKYLLLARIKPGEEMPIVRITRILAWPDHGYEKDREAFAAMIEAVSI